MKIFGEVFRNHKYTTNITKDISIFVLSWTPKEVEGVIISNYINKKPHFKNPSILTGKLTVLKVIAYMYTTSGLSMRTSQILHSKSV